jgi:hypothetical protein
MLRRFKRDSSNSIPATLIQAASAIGVATNLEREMRQFTSLTSRGVMSLVMHPDKNRPQMLLMSQDPPSLRVYNMSSYRVHSSCSGFSPTNTSTGCGAFMRASLSADGRYIACGNCVVNAIASTAQHSENSYQLAFWDTQTGNKIKSALSGELILNTNNK